MVTTGNEEWAERIRKLRLHGISRDAWKRYSTGGSWYYEVTEAGYKYNLTDIQAALGISQLRKLDAMREMRKRIAERYTEAFSGSEALTPLALRPERSSSHHLYVLGINPDAHVIDRAGFIEELGRRGIGTSVHFIPLHRHPFYRSNFGYESADFPSAERLYERIISLPIYPGLSARETDYVIENIKDVSSKHSK
jgi:perosamine synthetase